VTVTSPQQIVFIDSRVPDLQDLLGGLAPGEQAFVLDPSSDGVQQIADILAANDLTDLSSISIVSHGAPGEVQLGASLVTDQNLASYSSALAEIGASVAPGGNILLFGCDVGSGAAGMQFLNDLSTLTSGTVIGAATHEVGSAAQGGTWTLDASTGALTAGAPFTADALANFQGLLPAAGTVEVWVAATEGGTGNGLFHADDTGSGTASNTVTLFTPSSANNPTGVSHLTDVALDTQNGFYFLDFSDATGKWIVRASLSQALNSPAATPTFTTLYTDTSFSGILGIAANDATQKLYFIEKNTFQGMNYDGSGRVTLGTAANVSGGTAFVDGLALDAPHGTAYFFTNDESSTFTASGIATVADQNALYVDANINNTGTTLSTLPISPDDTATHGNNFPTSLGLISGIDVDTTNEILYFTTEQLNGGTAGIYKYNLTGNPSGTYSALWLEPSTGTQVLNHIQVDVTTGKYYVDDVANNDHSVLVGNLNSTLAPTTFLTLPTGAAQLGPLGLDIDNAPTLTITPLVNPTFTESVSNPASANNTPVSIISSATATDPDNTRFPSATVSIGGFFVGDKLNASGINNIVPSYNSTTGVLTFTSNPGDTFANYQAALASVTFTSTSDNPTDYGSDTTRTLTWVVNDGLLTSAPQTATLTVVGVNDPPTLSNVATNPQFTEESVATLSPGLSVIDVDDLNLSNATVSITGGRFANDGDVLGFNTSGTSITASYDSNNERLILTGTDTLANYQTVLDHVTFNAGENPTNFGSNTTRTITWQVMDPSGTALGGSDTSTLSTSTLTITNVNDAPTLANVAASAAFTEEGAAVVLSSSVTATDPDNLKLASATVSVTAGAFAGDVLAATGNGTISTSYDSTNERLILTGSDTLANYAAVLDTVTFNAGENPTDFGSKATRTVTWVLNDGSASFALSAAQTTTISITNVNDPPTLAAVATSASYTEEGGAVTLSGGLVVLDPDDLKLSSATIKIAGGNFAGDGEVLSVNGVSNGTIDSGSITVSYNSTTETLTLTGTDALAAYQTALDDVTFLGGENPTNFGSNPTRTITWQVTDPSGTANGGSDTSNVGVTTLSITNVNDAPILNNVATSAHFTEEGGAVTLSNAVSVIDLDNLTLASATVSITGGTFANDGDVLAATGTGSITASYDSTAERLILSGSDTLANYQSVLDSVTFNDGENPTNFGSNPTRLVTWVLNDGGGSFNLSLAATTTISITNVNDAPTLAGVPATVAASPSSTITLAPSVTVTDPDNLKLASATVSFTGGTGDVVTASANGTSITTSYDAATETLTLTGSDTLAHYQTVLDRVTFSGTAGVRTVSWVLNDGSATSSPQTETVLLGNPPTLSNVAASAAWTEEGAVTTLSSNVTVTDTDSTLMSSATVSIAGGTFAGDADVLAANPSGTSITASYSSSTESLVLTGLDTKADYQTVLDSVTFHAGENPTDFDSFPTRTVTWVVADDLGVPSAPQTTTVSLTNVNDPPTLSNVATSAAWTEEGAAATLSGAVSVTDPDSATLTGATVALTDVSISNGHFIQFLVQGAPTFDTLSADTTGTSITASYNSSTETLTLTGPDTKAHYQQVLDGVTFHAGENPTNYGSDPTRTVTWTLNDGSGSFNTSTPVTSTISVTKINDPPTLSGVATSASFTEHGAAVTLAPSVLATDPDDITLTGGTVLIASGGVSGDILEVFDTSLGTTNTSGVYTGINVTYSYNSSTQTLTLSGTDTTIDYEHVLDNILFTSGENPTNFGSNPARTITWVVNDGGASNNLSTVATTTVSLTNVNDPPTIGVAASASYAEEGAAVTLSGSATVSDPDSLTLASATVSITGGKFAGDGDVLATTTTGTGITASYDSTNEQLTLSGADTLAHYQQVLDSVTFSAGENPTNFGSNPTRTVTWTLNDGSGSFALSSAATTTVSIANVNDAPTLASVVGVTSFTENGAAVTLSPSVTVSDPDNLKLAGATVSISNTFAGDGDVLAATTAGTAIAASYNATTETLTLSGADTLAHYQQVLDSITFSSSSHNPTNYGSNLSRVLTWVVNDGSASSNLSTAQFTTVVVTAVNDPPTLSNVAASAALSTVGQTVTISPALAVADPDNLKLASATVHVASGTFAGDGDVLAATTTGTSITASYNSATETLTLSGTDTLAHYQSVLDSVTFASGGNPTNSGANPTRTVTWQVDDGSASNHLSAAATTTITFQPVLRFIDLGDFDANARTDIAWASNGGGHATLWTDSNGTLSQFAIPGGAMGPEWTAYGAGDFNGDGKSDLLWLNNAGQAAVWELNGPNLIGFGVSAGQMGSEWHVAAIGDFNGDHKSDLLWVSDTGDAAVWTMNGTTLGGFGVSNGHMGTEWRVLGAGDFNQDGRSDVLWENTSGTVDIWEMNGANLSGFVQNATTAPANSRFVGVGHFNGASPLVNGGTSDIVWVDNTNHVTISETSNGHVTNTVALNGLDGPEWHLVGVGKFAGDINSDLLWVSNSGAANIWEVNGGSVTEIPINVPTGSTLQLKPGT
jgi:hypothetical protein